MTGDGFRLIETKVWPAIEACQQKNMIEWGTGLEEDQYLFREKGVHVRYTTEQGRISHWILQKQIAGSQDKEGWENVSFFESVRRPAYLKVKGEPIVDIWSHGIGSVFTPQEFRGHGYAAEMIKRGTQELKKWQLDGKTQDLKSKTLIALWSDIGHYYEKFGYKLWDITTFTIKVDLSDQKDSADLNGLDKGTYEMSIATEDWPPNVTPVVTESDICRFVVAEQDHMMRLLDEATERDGRQRVAITPNVSMIQQLNWRGIYLGEFLSRLKTAPTVFGAKTASSWVLWYHSYADKKLQILRMHSNCSTYEAAVDDVALLLKCAVCEAHKWGFSHVSIWRDDLPSKLNQDALPLSELDNSGIDVTLFAKQIKQRADLDVKSELRQGSWPMSYVDSHRQDIDWCFRGKYCWW